MSKRNNEMSKLINGADQVTQDAQLGVKKAEAAALVWSKKTLYLTYAW